MSNKQKHLARLDIFEQSIVLSRFSNSNSVHRCYIDTTQAIQLFNQIDSSGPWQVYDRSVVAIRSGPADRYSALLKIPAHDRTIRCAIGKRNFKFHLQLPNLLAGIDGDHNGWRTVSRLWSYSGALRPETILRSAPLPNCYGGGSICMGEVDTKQLAKCQPREFFERAFFQSTFTDHLVSMPLAGKKYRDLIQLYRKLEGRLPLSLLSQVGTFQEILNDG